MVQPLLRTVRCSRARRENEAAVCLSPAMGRRSGGAESQQLFAESAETSHRVDEMNLEDPVAPRALGVAFTNPGLVAVTDGKPLRLARGVLVGEMADEMSCAGRTELPARLERQRAQVVVE